ncbi:MAG: hypothetical protein AAFP90_06665 [Planctomycetota bacterium]
MPDPNVMTQAIGKEAWGDEVALGTVIVLLFGVLFWMLKSMATERKEMRDEHRNERKEWKTSADQRSDVTDGIVQEMTQAIRDLERSKDH